ncbi:MAG TPA: hypothetical protein ENN30_00035, partial [Candidatus Woesearchaeota archaeon]|nr:hypothetical protein [Candidatus Woesearchaeota archaeon]
MPNSNSPVSSVNVNTVSEIHTIEHINNINQVPAGSIHVVDSELGLRPELGENDETILPKTRLNIAHLYFNGFIRDIDGKGIEGVKITVSSDTNCLRGNEFATPIILFSYAGGRFTHKIPIIPDPATGNGSGNITVTFEKEGYVREIYEFELNYEDGTLDYYPKGDNTPLDITLDSNIKIEVRNRLNALMDGTVILDSESRQLENGVAYFASRRESAMNLEFKPADASYKNYQSSFTITNIIPETQNVKSIMAYKYVNLSIVNLKLVEETAVVGETITLNAYVQNGDENTAPARDINAILTVSDNCNIEETSVSRIHYIGSGEQKLVSWRLKPVSAGICNLNIELFGKDYQDSNEITYSEDAEYQFEVHEAVIPLEQGINIDILSIKNNGDEVDGDNTPFNVKDELTVELQVTDMENNPVEGAQVWYTTSRKGHRRAAETDSEGKSTFSYEISVRDLDGVFPVDISAGKDFDGKFYASTNSGIKLFVTDKYNIEILSDDLKRGSESEIKLKVTDANNRPVEGATARIFIKDVFESTGTQNADLNLQKVSDAQLDYGVYTPSELNDAEVDVPAWNRDIRIVLDTTVKLADKLLDIFIPGISGAEYIVTIFAEEKGEGIYSVKYTPDFGVSFDEDSTNSLSVKATADKDYNHGENNKDITVQGIKNSLNIKIVNFNDYVNIGHKLPFSVSVNYNDGVNNRKVKDGSFLVDVNRIRTQTSVNTELGSKPLNKVYDGRWDPEFIIHDMNLGDIFVFYAYGFDTFGNSGQSEVRAIT